MESIEKIPSWLRWILFFPAAMLSWKLVDMLSIDFIEWAEAESLLPFCFVPKSYFICAVTFIIAPVIFLAVAIGIAPTENKVFRILFCLSLTIISIPGISKILSGKSPTLYNPILGVPLWYEAILSIITLIIIGTFIVSIFIKKSGRSANSN